MRHLTLAAACLAVIGTLACAAAPTAVAASRFADDPYPSTYRPLPSEPVLLRNAAVRTGAGQRARIRQRRARGGVDVAEHRAGPARPVQAYRGLTLRRED